MPISRRHRSFISFPHKSFMSLNKRPPVFLRQNGLAKVLQVSAPNPVTREIISLTFSHFFQEDFFPTGRSPDKFSYSRCYFFFFLTWTLFHFITF